MLWWWNKNINQAEKIIQLGVEKISLSSAIIRRPELIDELAHAVGRQSVVGVLDVKKSFSKVMNFISTMAKIRSRAL